MILYPPNQYNSYLNQPSPSLTSPNIGTRVSPLAVVGNYGSVRKMPILEYILYSPVTPYAVLLLGALLAIKLGGSDE